MDVNKLPLINSDYTCFFTLLFITMLCVVPSLLIKRIVFASIK